MTRMPAWARRFSFVALLAICAVPATASAHPLVERGRRQYENADFRRAALTLRRAARARTLTRGDYIRLLETRALIHLARSQPDNYHHDLQLLASIDPGHAFGRDVPPDVGAEFARVLEALPGALRVVVATAPGSGTVVFTAHVEDDIGQLTRRVLLEARRAGVTEWRAAQEGRVSIDAGPGDHVEYAASAVGPGGAVLTTSGTHETPLDFVVPGGEPPPVARRVPDVRHVAIADDPGYIDDAEDDGGGGPSPWVWASAGAVVVAVGIVLAVVLLGGNDDTQPSFPTVPGY